MMVPKWEYSDETEECFESWRLHYAGKLIAMVARENGLYSAAVYPLGRRRCIGDVFSSASGAKAACVRQLRKTGVIA